MSNEKLEFQCKPLSELKPKELVQYIKDWEAFKAKVDKYEEGLELLAKLVLTIIPEGANATKEDVKRATERFKLLTSSTSCAQTVEANKQ